MVSRASLDRGFGRCIVNHSYKSQLKRYINRTCDRIVTPSTEQRTGRYRVLGADGLAEVGQQIGPGAVSVWALLCPVNLPHTMSAVSRCPTNLYPRDRAEYGGIVLSSRLSAAGFVPLLAVALTLLPCFVV